jgi:hypothetical protein
MRLPKESALYYSCHSLERDCARIRHPGQALRSRARAGIQNSMNEQFSLDSGSRDAQHHSSGMTSFSDYGTVSKAGIQIIGV